MPAFTNEQLTQFTTAQAVFETAATHLFEQGQRCTAKIKGSKDSCAYRGDNGMMCVYGVFIPDSEYRVEFESETVRTIYNERLASGSILANFTGQFLDLLALLQLYVHDDANNWQSTLTMRDALRGIASHLEYDYILDCDFLQDLSFADR